MDGAGFRHPCLFLAAALLWSCGGGGGANGDAEPLADIRDVIQPADDGGWVPETGHDAIETDPGGDTSDKGPPSDEGPDGNHPDSGETVVVDISTDSQSDTTDIGPPPCFQDEGCDDDDPCTVDSCDTSTGQCLHEPVPCLPGLSCFGGTCTEGLCYYSGTVSDTCFSGDVILKDDFETLPIDQWTVEDLALNQLPGSEIVWVPSDQRAHSGTSSLYFGNPEALDYQTGKVVASKATSGWVDAPAELPLTLTFWVWADIEDGDLWDVLSVALETEVGDIPVWTKKYGFPMKAWTPVAVDLSAFTDRTFRVLLTFNSVEHSFNDTEGVYVDDVFLLPRSSSLTCQEDMECDDGVPCTTDACNGGSCVHDFSSGCCSVDLDCDDFDACTVDLCEEGGCEHIPVANPLCCNTDWDCDDNNDCIQDVCSKNLCEYTVLSEPGCCTTVVQCDDFDTCTLDKCTDAHCFHFNTCCFSDEECNDDDPICTDDSCVDGACIYQPTGVPGCCAPEVAFFNFDNGGPGWTFTSSVGGVGWQVISGGQTESVSKPGALYYGDPQSWDFDNGQMNGGSAWSPPIVMQPGYPASLSTQVFMDSESGSTYDKLWVRILSDGVPTITVWTKQYVTTNTFFELSANLSAWAGRTIQVQFEFDTYDSLINGGKGVFVDDLKITTPCLPQTCTVDGDCNDGISGTKDICSGGICTHDF